jgi:hypothetical protein
MVDLLPHYGNINPHTHREYTMMNLGTETGSLVNHAMSRAKAALPDIGDGATLLSYTDRAPATVIDIFTRGKYQYVVVQCDHYTRTDPKIESDTQSYEYAPNTDGSTSTFRLVGDKWQAVYLCGISQRFKKSDGGLLLGHREKYHDFSF